MQIRTFEAGDAAAVRGLFIRVNRQLAPRGMEEAFEAYIARSLNEEVDHRSAHRRDCSECRERLQPPPVLRQHDTR